MRKQLLENAAYEVTTQVRAVEDALDTTLQEIAELQCAMLRARRTANVDVVTGQLALEELGSAIQALISARGTIGKCHVELKSTKRAIPGLRTSMIGEDEPSPPPPKGELVELADQPLRIVA